MAVTGSVRTSADVIRVTANLVDGASGCYLWSETLDFTTCDFAAQEAIAQAVVRKLQPGPAGRGAGSRRPVDNLAARNLYLQGRYHLNQRTEEGLQKAVEFFERAIGEDSQYALAHSGLADGYGLLTHYGVLPPAQVWTKAASSAASAVMLDPGSAEAHTSLAHVKSTQDWDWQGAESEFQLAISLDPSYATAHHWFAMSCLVPIGRLDEALDEMFIAQSLDPVSSIVARDLALVHLFRRDHEAALEQCDHTIELNPHFSPAYWTLGLVQEQRKDFDEAAAAFQRAIHLSPQTPRMQAALARTLALAEKRTRGAGAGAAAGGSRQAALRVAVRVRARALRPRTDGPGLPLAHEGVSGPVLRADPDASRSATRSTEDRSEVRRDRQPNGTGLSAAAPGLPAQGEDERWRDERR